MNLRICGLLGITAFAFAGILASAQSLAQNAYITNEGYNTVSVVNTMTNSVTATIPVGNLGGEVGVAVTPAAGGKVYVANNAVPGAVLVIDTSPIL
jgi:YVTN family beta-propeller protein